MRPSFQIPRFATKFTKSFTSKRFLTDFVKSTNSSANVKGNTPINALQTITVLKEKNYSKYPKPSALQGKAKILEKKRRELMERCKPPIYNDDIQELSPYALDIVSRNVSLKPSDVFDESTESPKDEKPKSITDDVKIAQNFQNELPDSQKEGKKLEKTNTKNEKKGLEPILPHDLQSPLDLPTNQQIPEDVLKGSNFIKELTDGDMLPHKDYSDIEFKTNDIKIVQKSEYELPDSSKAEKKLEAKTKNEKTVLVPEPLHLLDSLQSPLDLSGQKQILKDVLKDLNSVIGPTDEEVVTHKDGSGIKSKTNEINIEQQSQNELPDSQNAENSLGATKTKNEKVGLEPIPLHLLDSLQSPENVLKNLNSINEPTDRDVVTHKFKTDNINVVQKLERRLETPKSKEVDLLKNPALKPKLDDVLKNSKAIEISKTAVQKFVVDDEFGVSMSETEIERSKNRQKDPITMFPEKYSVKPNQDEETTFIQTSKQPLNVPTFKKDTMPTQRPRKRISVELPHITAVDMKSKSYQNDLEIDDASYEITPLKKTVHTKEMNGTRMKVEKKVKHETKLDSNYTKTKIKPEEPSREVKPAFQQKENDLVSTKKNIASERPNEKEIGVRESIPQKSKTILRFRKGTNVSKSGKVKVSADNQIDENPKRMMLNNENNLFHRTNEIGENKIATNKDKNNETSSTKVIKSVEQNKIYVTENVPINKACSSNGENTKVPNVEIELENHSDYSSIKKQEKTVEEQDDHIISLEETRTKHYIPGDSETSFEMSKTIDNVEQTEEQISGFKESKISVKGVQPKVSGNIDEDMKMNFLNSMKPKFSDTKSNSWNKDRNVNMKDKETKSAGNMDSMQTEYKSKENKNDQEFNSINSNVEKNVNDVNHKTKDSHDLLKEFSIQNSDSMESTSEIAALSTDYKDEKEKAIENNNFQTCDTKTDLKSEKSDHILLNDNLKEDDSYIKNSDSIKLSSEIDSLQPENSIYFEQYEKENEVTEKQLTPSLATTDIDDDLKSERTSKDAVAKEDSDIFKEEKVLADLPVNKSKEFDEVQSNNKTSKFATDLPISLKNEKDDEIEKIINVKSRKKLDFEDESAEKLRKSFKNMDLKDLIENMPKISMERIEKLANAVEKTRKAVKKAKVQLKLSKYKTNKLEVSQPKTEDQTESSSNNTKNKPSISFSKDAIRKKNKPIRLSKYTGERVMHQSEPKKKDETKNSKSNKEEKILTQETIPSIKLIATKSKKKSKNHRNKAKITKADNLTEHCTNSKTNGLKAGWKGFQKAKDDLHIGFVDSIFKTEDDKKSVTSCTTQTIETSEKNDPKSFHSTDVINEDNLKEDELKDDQVTSESEKPLFEEMSMPKNKNLSAVEKRKTFIKSTLHLKHSNNNEPSIDQKPPSKNCASDAKIIVLPDVTNESPIQKSKSLMFGTSIFWSLLPFTYKSNQIQVPKPSLDKKKPIKEFEGELEKWKSFSSKKPEDDDY